MTKVLNIRINRPGGWLDEYNDDSMLYFSGLFDLFNFMMYPTTFAINYFTWKGWKFFSSPSVDEIWLSNFTVNKMIAIKSYRISETDCWRVEEIYQWDCVALDANISYLN